MKVETFWNKAFLAALSRLSAEEAKKEADLATELCIKQWQEQQYRWTHPEVKRWMEHDIAKVPVGQRGGSSDQAVASEAARGA